MNKDTSLLHQEQVELLAQIGHYLCQIREEQRLSLDEVAAKTMIQPRLLKAIETGKLHHLPEPVYVQGFIKRYADALGLDGTEFAQAFPLEGQLRVTPLSWKDSPAAQLRPLHLYVAYITLIMASVGLLSYVVNRAEPLANAIRPNTSSLAQSPQASPAPTQNPNNQNGSTANPKPSGMAIANPTNPATGMMTKAGVATPGSTVQKPVRVDVKLTGQSWLQVEVDGTIDFEGVLSEGTERTWMANSQLRVRSGNAGGVFLSHNGSQGKPMGEPGAVEEMSFSLNQNSASLPDTNTAIAR